MTEQYQYYLNNVKGNVEHYYLTLFMQILNIPESIL